MDEDKRNPDAAPNGNAAAEGTPIPGEKKKEKLTRRERRKRWKAAKRAKRQELKDYYQYAPWLKRVWNLYLKGFFKRLLGLAILLSVVGMLVVTAPAILPAIMGPVIREYYDRVKNQPLTEDQIQEIYEMSPIDDEDFERIEALPSVGADETWTICVYFIGADLEDSGENDLSYVTSAMTRRAREANATDAQDERFNRLTRFNDELAENGLELPAFFYYPDVPVASSSTPVTQDVIVSDRLGCASADINELTSGVWSDNIQIVMQPGGATHWSNDMVNPNRTQRFLYKNGKFTEVSNLALQPAAEPDTLAEFLRFCKDEYPADHTMLILWDHGGGPFGYGMDSIYGQMLTLKDIRTALESVYRPNSRKPAFDIIGFDACLMSCLEVTNALDGFADYYCLSEESEPGDGWDYGPFLQAMTDDPTMSPAKVCREIADAYTDYYMIQNINVPLFAQNTTFSVIDAHKASELYDAYCDLAEAQLKDAVKDMGVLAEIGRCGSRATRYGFDAYNVFNTVDIGNYVDYMIDSYPEACSRIKDLVGETVLYHRQNGALCDSTGIAVYLPTEVSTLPGLVYYLDYIYNVSNNDSVSALYYYKQAGCLNEDLKEYVATLTDAEPKVLDVTPFTKFSKTEPTFDADGFLIPVEDKLQNLMTEYELEVGRYDEDKNTITYYGRDQVLYLDGEGSLCSNFDGSWICLNGAPLYVDVVSSTASVIEYMAHVYYDGSEAYLMIAFDRDTETFTLNGIREVESDDDANFLVSTRSMIEPEAGKSIVPIYEETNYSTGETRSVNGKKISFSAGTKITREQLPNGYYLSTAVITDTRGDNYYSQVVGSTVSGKEMKDWTLDERFFGRDY